MHGTTNIKFRVSVFLWHLKLHFFETGNPWNVSPSPILPSF